MLLNIYYRFYECRKIYRQVPTNHGEWSPPIFFRVFYGYTNILFHLSTWNILWRHKKSIYKLFEFPTYDPPFRSNSINILIQKISYINSVVTICLSVILTISGVGLFGTYNSQIQTNWFGRYIQTGKDLLFLLDDASNFKVEKFQSQEILLGVITITCYYLRHLVGIFEEFFTFMIIFPIWVHILGFIKSLEDRQHSSWNSVKNEYLSLKQIVDKVNELIGLNLFLHTLIIMFAYSYTLTFILNSIMPTISLSEHEADTFAPLRGHQLRFVVKLFVNFSVYYCSADINCQVSKCIVNIVYYYLYLNFIQLCFFNQ